MDIRIQHALDGDLARDELSEAEKSVLAEAEAAIQGVLRAVPVQALPSLGTAVLERIASLPETTPRRSLTKEALSWLWAPRPIPLRWRPAYALPVAAVLAFAMLMGRGQEDGIPTDTPAQVLVEFRLNAPQARYVALAGDFTAWKPTYTLVRGEPGVWTVVVPLDPGVHDYAFIVDGERWVPDPMAPAIDDGFGGYNSRVAVLPPDVKS